MIGVVSQAIAQLSLAHTLETAVERIAELTGERPRRHLPARGRASSSRPPPRGLRAPSRPSPSGCSSSRSALPRARLRLHRRHAPRRCACSGLESPGRRPASAARSSSRSLVHDEVIGALGVFKTRPRPYREGEEGLLSRSRASSPSPSRTRACTSARRSSASASSGRSTPSAARRASSAASTRSRTPSREPLARGDARRGRPQRWSSSSSVDAAAIRMPDARGEALELRARPRCRRQARAHGAPRSSAARSRSARRPRAGSCGRAGRSCSSPAVATGEDVHASWSRSWPRARRRPCSRSPRRARCSAR